MTEEKTINLKSSKFYDLCRQEQLLAELIPDIAIQMAMEEQIDANYQRDETDGDSTRIIILYTNVRGNTSVFKLNDHNRFETPTGFDIDNFIVGYEEFVFSESESVVIEDPVLKMGMTVLTALNFAVIAALRLDDEDDNKRTAGQAELFIKAAVACLYDDQKDVMIVIKESAMNDDEPSSPLINNLWVVKKRP